MEKDIISYDGDSIRELSDRDAVRQRPGMYIGGSSNDNMHHLVWEIINNSIDEFIAGSGSNLSIKLNNDNSITIEDDGRGIPVSINKESGLPAIRSVFEKLHAGGKFDTNTYKTSGGLHGVGASVTNFLSKYLICEVKRGGKLYRISYESGYLKEELKEIGTTNNETETGTKVTFLPDDEIFGEESFFIFDKIITYVENQSYLLPKITINLEDRNGEVHTFFGKGISDLLDKINEKKQPLIKKIEGEGKDKVEIKKGKEKLEKQVEIKYVFQYINSEDINTTSFVNNIITKHGGAHVKGLEKGIQKSIEEYIVLNKVKIGGKDEVIKAQDFLKGFSSVISVYYSEPEFIGQTKEELGNEEITKPIMGIIKENFLDYLLNNPSEAKIIMDKIRDNIKLRKLFENAKENIFKNEGFFASGIPGKLKNCSGKDPTKNELFIVEGDSAGGSSNQARDKETQGVLALKGKVINAIISGKKNGDQEESISLVKVLKNAEVGTIINALGCGILDNYDNTKLNYHKIIINTDQDPDGWHITGLLVGLFFILMPKLIEDGFLYKGIGPLYGIEVGGKKHYVESEKEKDEFIEKLNGRKYVLYRFKGLGEMNPDQLKETMMNPKSRRLVQVKYEDYQTTKDYIERIMGKDTELKFSVTKGYTIDDVS